MSEKVGNQYSNRLKKNISWIFFGNIFHSVLSFAINVFVARKLTLSDNGTINYSASLIVLLTAIASLGFKGTITREFSEHKEKTGDYLCSCMTTHMILGIICMFALQIIIRIFNPGEPQLYLIAFCQSTTIVTGASELYIYWFRYNNNADTVAILRIVAFLIAAFWRVFALIRNSTVLYVCGSAAETAFFGILLSYYYFKNKRDSFNFSLPIAISVLKGSYPFIFSAILTAIYTQADKIMLKSMLDSTAVALYSVSVVIAGLLSIIPSSLIEAFRPDIMEYKYIDEKVYSLRFRQLYGIVFWISIGYCLLVSIFAKQIIIILYGEKYIGAISSLSLVVWYSAFSYFGPINNMYMVAEKKTKWVQITTFFGACVNVLLNCLMIPYFGIVGAAAASLITQFIANFAIMWVIKDLRPGFYNLLAGIALKEIDAKAFVSMTRRITKR